jgi:M6 family metalloprotease-like protein
MKKLSFHLLLLLPFLAAFSISEHQQPAGFIPESYQLNYQQVRSFEGYRTAMPSQGQVNMLVIPISFSDYSCQAIVLGCDQTLQDIEQAFFGDPDDMRWHSVSSYYHQSSYGALTISGTVSDWYTPDITAVDLSKQSSLLNSRVIFPALAWYRNLLADQGRSFDADRDGYLDAVYFIYSLPFNPQDEAFGSGKDIFWAFVSYVGGPSNPTIPSLFHFGWSSYQFMYEDGYYQRSENGKVEWDEDNQPIFNPHVDEFGNLQVDAHVFIHEVGHLLGLVDYYSYDRQKGDWGPSGALDMMDYNVGDHNAYSKNILGWTKPYVVTGPSTIQLLPFATTGHHLLITPQFNNTLLDEYLLVEFYTPTGLNQKDSEEPYAGRYPRMFTDIGVKIYHVDARVAQYVYLDGMYRFTRYVTEITSVNQTLYRMGHSNTMSRSIHPEYKLIHLLESSGENSFKHRGFATNDTLFQQGQVFQGNVFEQFTFNSGLTLPFTIEIGPMTESGVTIIIHQKN